jgi:transcriptional regulator with XRE-family HTH domain
LACYRELGAELRQRRKKAGLAAGTVAEAAGWDRTKVSRIEYGRVGLSVVDVIHYLGICGVRIPEVQDLIRLCEDAERELGYWLSPPKDQIGASFSSLIYHESTARSIVLYDPMVINGLLQTTDYARTLISHETWRDEAEVERLVDIRTERRQILHRPRPAKFMFVVHEQALRNLVGSGRIMHEQLLQVVLLGGLDNASLRVMPTSAAEQAAFGGAFQLLNFAGGATTGPSQFADVRPLPRGHGVRERVPPAGPPAFPTRVGSGTISEVRRLLGERVRPRESRAACGHLRVGGRAPLAKAARQHAWRWCSPRPARPSGTPRTPLAPN